MGEELRDEMSALVVLVPEAEELVGRLRQLMDPSAAWGVPAHMTVLYPFLPPGDITGLHLETLRDTFAAHATFDCHFSSTGWFDTDVLWLAPQPVTPLRALTVAAWKAFPQCPPYGGSVEGIIPHLTVGHSSLAKVETLRAAERLLLPQLPFQQWVTQVALVAGTQEPTSWRILEQFELGNP